jgi:uncharacterized protein
MEPTLDAFDESPPVARTLRARSLLKFFVLVFSISAPFWIVGAVTGLQLFPGLPVAAFAVVCPAAAASILAYRESRAAGVAALLNRSFDYKRIKAKEWYAPVFLLMPAVMVLSYGLQRMMGRVFSPPDLTLPVAVAMSFAFVVSALAEEIGWSGYATDLLDDRSSALQTGLVLGGVWAVWHFVPLAQAHRSVAWIAWWCVGTVALRVILVWLYNNTGKSVFATALFHAMSNVCTILFAVYYDPVVTNLTIALTAAIVTVVWGPRTLARWKTA